MDSVLDTVRKHWKMDGAKVVWDAISCLILPL
jgi:hypothetical protein